MILALDLALPVSNPTVQFLLLFSIVLIAPIVFNRIKVPSLIGLIIAGAVIGPFGLFIMSRDSNMIMLGNAGLLYIMFLAGIEIDVAEFKKNSSRSLVFGLQPRKKLTNVRKLKDSVSNSQVFCLIRLQKAMKKNSKIGQRPVSTKEWLTRKRCLSQSLLAKECSIKITIL